MHALFLGINSGVELLGHRDIMAICHIHTPMRCNWKAPPTRGHPLLFPTAAWESLGCFLLTATPLPLFLPLWYPWFGKLLRAVLCSSADVVPLPLAHTAFSPSLPQLLPHLWRKHLLPVCLPSSETKPLEGSKVS